MIDPRVKQEPKDSTETRMDPKDSIETEAEQENVFQAGVEFDRRLFFRHAHPTIKSNCAQHVFCFSFFCVFVLLRMSLNFVHSFRVLRVLKNCIVVFLLLILMQYCPIRGIFVFLLAIHTYPTSCIFVTLLSIVPHMHFHVFAVHT